jgi:hypothetical protein
MNNLVCPNCGKEISEAFKKSLEKDVLEKMQKIHENDLEEARKQGLESAENKIKAQFDFQIKQALEESKSKEEQNKKLLDELTSLTVKIREFKKEKDEATLQMQKKLSDEEEKIRHLERKKAEEESRSKVLELQKQLTDVSKANDDLRRKINQGSQQTQGEAFEKEFENMLRQEFSNDEIGEVAKGVKGADVSQSVIDRNGNICGKILWEIKNTKSWSEQWVEKLKEDQRQDKADYAVIVSDITPENVNSAKFYKNIWVTKQAFVIGLASALRLNLIQLSMAKRANNGKKDKSDILFSYLSGTEFRLRIEAIIDAFSNMQNEIEKEKRYFSNKWARDEKNIRHVIDHTYGMHGDLKAIVGSSLAQIKDLSGLDQSSS